jgi:hypothetical protein
MTNVHLRGRTAQTVRNRAKKSIVITRINKLQKPKRNGMYLYSVTYHHKKK